MEFLKYCEFLDLVNGTEICQTHLGSGISGLEGFLGSGLTIELGEDVGKCILLDLLLMEDILPKPLVAVGDIQLFPISLLYLMLVYSLPSCIDF